MSSLTHTAVFTAPVGTTKSIGMFPKKVALPEELLRIQIMHYLSPVSKENAWIGTDLSSGGPC